MEAKRLTMELNTGDIAIKKDLVYNQWKEDAGGNLDGIWRGSSVEFFPPFNRFFHPYQLGESDWHSWRSRI
jgi:hypothetical protein